MFKYYVIDKVDGRQGFQFKNLKTDKKLYVIGAILSHGTHMNLLQMIKLTI